MPNEIYNIKIGGIIELESKINPDMEYSVCLDRIAQKSGKFASRIDSSDRVVTTFYMENLGKATLISGEGVIKGKAKKMSYSQILRNEIMKLHQEQYAGEIEEEKFYEDTIKKFINEIKNLREIL